MVSIIALVIAILSLALSIRANFNRPDTGETVKKKLLKKIKPEPKAEFLPPMTEDEYDQYILDQSSHGELMKKLLNPWISNRNNTQ